MYRGARADFVYTVTRDFVRNCQTPILVLPDDVPGTLCRGDGDRASRAQRAGKPLSVEGHPGQNPAGGAPYPQLSPRPSTCCSSAIHGSRCTAAPDTSFPASRGARYDGPWASRRAMTAMGITRRPPRRTPTSRTRRKLTIQRARLRHRSNRPHRTSRMFSSQSAFQASAGRDALQSPESAPGNDRVAQNADAAVDFDLNHVPRLHP